MRRGVSCAAARRVTGIRASCRSWPTRTNMRVGSSAERCTPYRRPLTARGAIDNLKKQIDQRACFIKAGVCDNPQRGRLNRGWGLRGALRQAASRS